MAPASAGGGLNLPSLTNQVSGGGDTAPAGQAPAATGQAPAAGQTVGTAGTPAAGTPAAGAMPAFDINTVASQGRWLGPLLAVGGGIAALTAFAKGQDGSKFLKFGGITSALGGLALTGVGFKAKGIEVGKQAAETEGVAALNQLATIAEQEIATRDASITALQQQVALAQQNAGTAGADPAATGTGPGTEPGTGTGQQGTPGVGDSAGIDMGSTSSSAPVGPGAAIAVVPTNDAYASVTATPNASGWSVQSLVGQSVQLTAGTSAAGTVIAEGGQFRIEQPAGDPNGYATLAEANDAARQSMSTKLAGSRYMRWMVVEHGGRFYGAIAKQLEQGEQAQPLNAQLGNVVAWSALNHVEENNASGFQAYSWNASEGAQSMAVPYGTTSVFPSGIGASTQQQNVGTTPTTGTPQVTGGGQAATTGQVASTAPTAFNPATQIGRSFAVNAAVTAEGDVVRGGDLQLQKFVDISAGGFGTAEEAATVARTARAQSGEQGAWTRWVSLQGSDGRFYLYEGSIVARATAPLESAAPVHVFGVGSAGYFDGATNAWKAVRDAG